MKRNFSLLVVLAATLVSMNAFAQVAQCPDVDEDKYAVCSASCVLAAGTKCGDCDDKHAEINPGATELWDNEINDDCKIDAWESSSGDRKSLNVSGGPDYVARYAKGLGRSITPKSSSELRLLKDIMACKSAGTNCTTDSVGGKLNPSTGFRLVDTDCDGVINVVPETYSSTIVDQEKCRKAAAKAAPKAPTVRRAAPAVTLPGQATPTAPAPKGVRGAAVDWSAPIATAQATANKALQTATEASAKVNTFDAAIKDHGDRLTAFDTALAEEKAALAAEVERATAAEGLIDTKAQAAIDRSTEALAAADLAKATAEGLEKKGVLVELSLGGASLFGHDANVTKNSKVYQMRGNTSPGGYVGLNVGFANETGRFNGFFNLLPLADDGPKGWESSIAYQGGVEATFAALHGLGVHALFLQHAAGGSVVGANSYSRGVGGGISYATTTAGSDFKVGFQGRASVGVESYGAGKGSDTSAFAALSLGINFGFGPK